MPNPSLESGLSTAGRLARAAGRWHLILYAGEPRCRGQPLSSNVRQHKHPHVRRQQ